MKHKSTKTVNNIFYLPTIYGYMDETSLVLCKLVCKEFYDIVRIMVDQYNVKASRITYASMLSGTLNLAIYAHKYHVKPYDDLKGMLIKYSCISTLQYFTRKNIINKHGSLEYYSYAVNNGIDMLRYIYEQNEKTNHRGDELACGEAGRFGKLDCLRFLHSNGFKWNYLTSYQAAWFGHIDCFRYAIENGCEWDYINAGMCDNGNNSECMKYY